MRVHSLVIEWIQSLASNFFGVYKIEDPTNLAPMDLASRSPVGTKAGMSRPTVACSVNLHAKEPACHQFNRSRPKLRLLARVILFLKGRLGPTPVFLPALPSTSPSGLRHTAAARPAHANREPRRWAQADSDSSCGRSISCTAPSACRARAHLGPFCDTWQETS